MADIERMQGKFDAPEQEGGMAVLKGSAPVVTMRDYQKEVISYTRGRGRLSLSLKGYEPCHNEDEVIRETGYDFDTDLQDPAGSVFCSHGAGFTVPWDEVKNYMHVESPLAVRRAAGIDLPGSDVSGSADGIHRLENGVSRGTDGAYRPGSGVSGSSGGGRLSASLYEDRELHEIFVRTYGEPKRPALPGGDLRRVIRAQSAKKPAAKTEKEETEPIEEYLLVDGYNIIFAWEELAELAKVNIDGARYRLMDILCNYQGYKKCTLIVVFDAYKVVGNTGEALKYHNIHVVYTKEAETADQYIEKLAHKIGPKYHVTVATSDGLEQLIIRGQGCMLLSARDLKEEVDYVNALIAEEKGKLEGKQKNGKNYLLSHADGETKEYLEKVRLGKEEKR